MKKLSAIILAAVILVSAFSLSAFAADSSKASTGGESGAAGKKIKWSWSNTDGILNITGTGAMYDYDTVDSIPLWQNYSNEISKIVISDGVTKIGAWAFRGLDNVTSVSIPNSVTTIKTGAFSKCSSIKSVKLPKSLSSFAVYSFVDCSALTKFSISGNEKFYCSDGNLYYKNSSVRKLIVYAPGKNAKSFKIPTNVSVIYKGAFDSCSKLTSVTIPSGTTEIGDYAFEYCTGLKSIKIPNKVTTLGIGAFYACSKLSTAAFGNALKTIKSSAFESTALKKAYIPRNVQTIGDYALGFKYNEAKGTHSKVSNAKFYCVKGTKAETALKNYKKKCGTAYSCLSLGSKSLNAGATVSIKPAAGTVKSWFSDKKSVAAVKNGKVYALKKGTAKMTAKLSDGSKITGKVTVKNNPKLSKSSVSVNKNKTVSVTVTGKSSALNNVYHNTDIAKITSKKNADTLKVKGLKKGTTTLRIKVNGMELKLKVDVK